MEYKGEFRCDNCKEVIYYLLKKYEFNDVVSANDFKPVKRIYCQPVPNTRGICPNCGNYLQLTNKECYKWYK